MEALGELLRILLKVIVGWTVASVVVGAIISACMLYRTRRKPIQYADPPNEIG